MGKDLRDKTRLKLTVTGIKFAGTDFAVFDGLYAPRGQASQTVTVTSSVLVSEGQEVVVDGRFIDHPRFGFQFRATTLVKYIPENTGALLTYLSGGNIQGVGPKLAKAIVSTFGDETLKVLESEPWRLRQIDGIGPEKSKQISDQISEERSYIQLLEYLESIGVGSDDAARIHAQFRVEALRIVKGQPELIEGVRGLSPKAIATIRVSAPWVCSEERGKIAAYQVLTSFLAKTGHTAYPLSGWLAEVKKTHPERGPIDENKFAGDLHQNVVDFKVRDERWVTTERIFKQSKWIFDQLHYRAGLPHSAIASPDPDLESSLIADQVEQYRHLCSTPNSLLIGAPGTGKTHLVKALLKTVMRQAPETKISLAAPTGQAAARLSEGLHHRAKTIHRLLGSRGPLGWTYNFDNQLDCDLLIIDEVSMLDEPLFASVLSALPSHASLLLVGDPYQVKSIGLGHLLRDLSGTPILPKVELRTPVRFGERSVITAAARDVLNGEAPSLSQEPGDGYESARIVIENTQDIFPAIARLLKTLDTRHLNQVCLISPSRRGPCGSAAANKYFQKVFNRNIRQGAPYLTNGEFRFYAGDRVIQTRNNYDLNLFNGQSGFIQDVDPHSSNLSVTFGQRTQTLTRRDIADLDLGYAMTIHKIGYTDLMVDGAPLPHQPDTIIRWLIDRLRS